MKLTESIIYKSLGEDGPFCFTVRKISTSNEHLIYWRCSLTQVVTYSAHMRKNKKIQLPDTAENLIAQ